MLRSGLYSRQMRIALVGLLLCGALPAAARAQQVNKQRDDNRNFATTVSNPCNGDQVAVQGRQQTRTEQSANRFRFRSHTDGDGTGTPSQAQYNYQDINENEVVTTATTFSSEFQEREHLIRQGKNRANPTAADDFFRKVRNKFVVTNGNVTTDRTEDRTECK